MWVMYVNRGFYKHNVKVSNRWQWFTFNGFTQLYMLSGGFQGTKSLNQPRHFKSLIDNLTQTLICGWNDNQHIYSDSIDIHTCLSLRKIEKVRQLLDTLDACPNKTRVKSSITFLRLRLLKRRAQENAAELWLQDLTASRCICSVKAIAWQFACGFQLEEVEEVMQQQIVHFSGQPETSSNATVAYKPGT